MQMQKKLSSISEPKSGNAFFMCLEILPQATILLCKAPNTRVYYQILLQELIFNKVSLYNV